MSLAAGVIFKTSEAVDFVAELALWISPPTELPSEAPAAESEGEEPPPPPPVEPSVFQQECTALEAQQDFQQLGAKLSAALKERIGTEPVQDVECAYTLLLQLLMKWEMLPDKVLGLADEIGSCPEERPLLRRTLLLSLFSLVQQWSLTELRFPVLLKLIIFGTKAKLLDSILGDASKRVATVEYWIKEWQLSEEQKKQLWGLIFDAFIDDSSATYDNALKYLTLHEASSLQAQPDLRKRLVESVIVTLRSPEMLNCDKLAQLAIVKQLSEDAEYQMLDELLKIFAHQMYEDYLKFYEQPGAQEFLEKHALVHADCERKMRLLSLVSLGQASKELTYSAVAAALQVERDEVETWIMESISCGLMAAKMDQVRELVLVSVCHDREFGSRQWNHLKSSLTQWSASVQALLQVVQDARSN
eukprot:CAMPEP_0119326336 /NCGR_PEP_ID=MMETSP1333-20130426/68126_1 /TAXON_ID=418940 /ORGANISM="Scyphosphaera apsteinii, Strain RCC1455" /LENGTH=416 /DNA_ID=CAMNT_0007334621 /DNA_START=68 /DNA_END=1318 /DNA_ORIENTATION=+